MSKFQVLRRGPSEIPAREVAVKAIAIAALATFASVASCSLVLPFDELTSGDQNAEAPVDGGSQSDAAPEHADQDSPGDGAALDDHSDDTDDANGHVDADASSPEDADATVPDSNADGSPPTGWVDCQTYPSDPKCVPWAQANPGSVGDGIGLSSDTTAMGGFVEGDHVVVAVRGLAGSAIITVALDSGDRTLVSGSIKDAWTSLQTRGAGPLSSFIDVDPNPAGGWVAVAGDGSVIAIDPTTGDRSLSMQLQQMSCEGWSGLDPAVDYGVAVDASGAVLVGVSNQSGTYGIVRATPSGCTMVSFAGPQPETTRGSGPEFAYGLWGLTLFEDAVWIASPERSVMRVELATGDRSWVTKVNPPVGSGSNDNAFEALTHHEGDVWTGAIHGLLRLMKIDPVTHNREAYYATSGPASAVPQSMSPYSVTLLSHPVEDLLIVLTDTMMLYDVHTGDSNYLSR